MKVKKLCALILCSFTLISLVGIIDVVATTNSLAQTNQLATEINKNLLDNFLQNKVKANSGGLLGHGWAKTDKFVYPIGYGTTAKYYGIENIYAASGLRKLFLYQGDSRGDLWTSQQIILQLENMYGQSQSRYGIQEYDDNAVLDERDTFLQFLALDQLSLYYADTHDATLYTKLQAFYNACPTYRANLTSGYYGRVGGYWTRLQGNYKDVTILECRANVSLMAAAGLARFSTIIPSNDPTSHPEDAIEEAEQAMAFCEEYTYKAGFYTEFDGDSSDIIHLKTQAYALNAFAQLYMATGKSFYIYKADALLRKITETFWDAGRGGAIELYNISTQEPVNEHADGAVKWGYSNVLLAQGCVELYKATGNRVYMGMAEEIMNFMYNYLWDGATTDIMGYDEWCLRNGTKVTPPEYAAAGLDPSSGQSYAKFSKTNMLALQINAEISWANRPWYVEYMWYLIIGGLVAAAVIMVVVLVTKKRSAGRALPKVVKGLLGGED